MVRLLQLPSAILEDSCLDVTVEERARAVVAYFPAIPERVRREVESVVARSIRRAVAQELAGLEREADSEAIRAEGGGKRAKGRDVSAIRTHRWWEERLKRLRQVMLSPAGSGSQAREEMPKSVRLTNGPGEARNAEVLSQAVLLKPRMVRAHLLRVGDLVVVHPGQGLNTQLPEGLSAGSKARVVAVENGTVSVVDLNGKRFQVIYRNIELPCDLWWKGKWINRFRDAEGEEAYRRVVEGVSQK